MGKSTFEIAADEKTVWFSGLLALVIMVLLGLDALDVVEVSLGWFQSIVLIAAAVILGIEAFFETKKVNLGLTAIIEGMMALITFILGIGTALQLQDVTSMLQPFGVVIYFGMAILLGYELFINRK